MSHLSPSFSDFSLPCSQIIFFYYKVLKLHNGFYGLCNLGCIRLKLEIELREHACVDLVQNVLSWDFHLFCEFLIDRFEQRLHDGVIAETLIPFLNLSFVSFSVSVDGVHLLNLDSEVSVSLCQLRLK